MTSPLLAAVIAGMPSGFAAPGDTAQDTRSKLAPLHGHPLHPDTEVRIDVIGGVRCGRLSTPASRPDRGTAVFFHGGAFVSCGLEAYLFYAEFVADHLRLPVVTFDYRLAPEHRFPAAVDDAYDAVLWAASSLAGGRPLVVAGDSAGGNLAAVTALRARDTSGPPLALQVLVYPVTDHDLDRKSYHQYDGTEFIVNRRDMAWFWDHYAPDPAARVNPYASPLRAASLTGLPPLLLQVGQVDATRLDAERTALAARAAGTDARLDVVPGGIHGHQGLVGLGVPEAVAAWDSVTRFADELLGP